MPQALWELNKFVAGRRTPSRAREGALVWYLEMNCSRRHPCWESKRFYWEGVPERTAAGYRNIGELLCHVACIFRFYMNGVSIWMVSAQSSFSAHIWSGSGSFSWGVHLLSKRDSSTKDSGRLVISLLLAPPKSSQLVLPGPYQGLLLWHNSRKQLLSSLAKVGSFSQWSSNNILMKNSNHSFT